MLVSNERAAPIHGCALLIPEHPNLETSHKPQATITSDKQQALDSGYNIGYCRMLNKLMEDTCLKDMQVTNSSSLKTLKQKQAHLLQSLPRSIQWTSLSSVIQSCILPSSSSSRIFRILTSFGVNVPNSNITPAARIVRLATFFSRRAPSDKQQATSFKQQAAGVFLQTLEVVINIL